MIELLLNVRQQKRAWTGFLQRKNQVINTSNKTNLTVLLSIAFGKVLPEEASPIKVQYVLVGILMAIHASQRVFYRI